jgi:AraC family transcriptional regulator of arabinose operon
MTPGDLTMVPAQQSSPDIRLARVLRAIADDSIKDVRTLARLVNLSPSRLQHLFREQLGIAIRDAIGEQKLRKAAWLLISTDKRIKEITFEVGYEHSSSFVRAFRKKYMKTPEKYRRCHGENTSPAPEPPNANIDCTPPSRGGSAVIGS